MPDAAELIRGAADRLRASGFDSARLDAEVLLRHVLRIDRTHLFLRMNESVSSNDVAEFGRLIEERLTGAPVAYLTGSREFMGLPFKVGPGVLVPRPETEMLVEWALAWIGKHQPATVVDVGTGSGAIILSLARALGSAVSPILIGSDRSAGALKYAIRNRRELALQDRVELVRGDLLTWVDSPLDLILANLPYLRPDQVVDNRDIQAEPEMALVAGSDGFTAIAGLISDLPRITAPGGAVIFELDPDQANRAAGMISNQTAGATVSIIPDLSGRDRFVTAEFE